MTTDIGREDFKAETSGNETSESCNCGERSNKDIPSALKLAATNYTTCEYRASHAFNVTKRHVSHLITDTMVSQAASHQFNIIN